MISIILLCCAGVCWAVMQTLIFHYEVSVFKNAKRFRRTFWDPNYSYVNKFKNNSPNQPFIPKFFGSTTFLVWTTDAWHLLDKIFLTLLFASVYFYPFPNNDLILFIDLLVGYVIFTISFEVTWRLLKVKK